MCTSPLVNLLRSFELGGETYHKAMSLMCENSYQIANRAGRHSQLVEATVLETFSRVLDAVRGFPSSHLLTWTS